MSVSFNAIPLDLWIYRIFPGISDVRTFCAFACTATWAREFIRNMAQHMGDINLAGKGCEYLCDENTPAKECIFQIFKIRVLKTHPELLGILSETRANAERVGEDPNNINNLHQHALNWDSELVTISPVPKFRTAIIPFDFQTQIINAGQLGRVLQDAILEGKIDLAQLAFAHPQSKKLDGYQIVCALDAAVQNDRLEIADILFSLPRAAEMPGFQPTPLTSVLGVFSSAVSKGNIKLVLKLASHPNAIDILNFPGLTYLESDLCKSLKSKKPKLVAAVLHHPRIVDLNEKSLYRAGRAILSEEDIEPLVELEELHEKDFERKELVKTFVKLTARTQYFFYLMLCKMHGSTSLGIEKQGMVHFVKHPESLLPIINQLDKTPKPN